MQIMNKSEKLLAQVKDGYNQIAEHFSRTRYAPWSEFGLFKEYIKDGQRILDLGCGNGRLVIYAAENFKVKAVGLEISLPLYLICRLRQALNKQSKLEFKFKNLFN